MASGSTPNVAYALVPGLPTAGARQLARLSARSAKIGQRKLAVRRVRGVDVSVNVPASYPGAPGRIGVRGVGGRIAAGRLSGGVRWRHPGLAPQRFIHGAITETALRAGLGSPQVHVGQEE